MGTPEFAVPPLNALADGPEKVVGVITPPDRRRGRGKKSHPPAVKVAAEEAVLPVFQTDDVNEDRALEQLEEWNPDVIVVCAFGQILSPDLLEFPEQGCLNIHASLLPRYRGAAPINWAIVRGEEETGVTIMEMDEGLDTGPILAQRAISITADETAGSLHDRLARLGADLLAEHLDPLLAGDVAPRPQPEAGACYAAKLAPEEAWLEPHRPAEALARQVRALSPVPGARTRIGERELRVLAAHPVPGRPDDVRATVARAGPQGIELATAEGRLCVTRLKPAGGRAQEAADYLNGHPVAPGDPFH